jgi:site-specific DNA recombinase
LLNFCRVSKPRPDYVIVHHVDRWARNGHDHDMLRAYLLKLGVKLRSYMQRLGEDPYDNFYERIMSGQAELDNKLRGMRSLAGMKTRVQSGRWTFKAPLGYINGVDGAGSKTLLLDRDRAPLISQAFELFATALYTKEELRARMNAPGLWSTRGKELSPETFDRMLRNPRYAGILSVDGWDITAEGDYPPLVTAEVFQSVQEILAGRRQSITARNRNHPDFRFATLCAVVTVTNHSLQAGPREDGGGYPYYRCQNRTCVSPPNIPNMRKQDLEDAFMGFLRQQQPDAAYLRLFHKVVLDVWYTKQADSVALVQKFESQVKELKQRKSKLNDAFVYHQSIVKTTSR